MQHYLATEQDDEGIYSYSTFSGENLFEAVKQALLSDTLSFHSIENFCCVDVNGDVSEDCCQRCDRSSCKHSTFDINAVTANVLEYVKNSYVNGDSNSQVTIFNITDPKNVYMELQ